jgi:pullulanase/glycogen debranching enzyme
MLLLVCSSTVSAASAHALQPVECSLPASETVLAPAAMQATDARAHWLDRRRLKWPGKKGSGSFRLYHSSAARVLAQAGKPVSGADEVLALDAVDGDLPPDNAGRFAFLADGVVLAVRAGDASRIPALLTGQLLLVNEDAAGRVVDSTLVQVAGALDDLYVAAAREPSLGVTANAHGTGFKLWAPTARRVSVCVQAADGTALSSGAELAPDATTGIWSLWHSGALAGSYYTYLVDVFVPGVGLVRNRVTDPYSISLDVDSRRSYIADLEAPGLKPLGWDHAPAPGKVAAQTDMVIYELHVRDFSINDMSVTPANRGKYLAFSEMESRGMRHLRALSEAGLTDVHLLPVFDFATVPESGCVTPDVPVAAPDSDAQQAAVMSVAARDCFNWGYDPYHFNAPEGSYASDAADGAKRILEFRQLVMALHKSGLRVGMDVVYNHTVASGQDEASVLDRIVPGYYHRLDANGVVERSTCCDNTATEHLMMGKLMLDSVELWARHYRIDSFRFDLMGHQPRAAMELLRQRVDTASGRDVNLIGEGWNFGEVADGRRFVQASQLSLNGSGIGTFSDRTRDAVRGGGPGDSGSALVERQGYINGLVYDRNEYAPERPLEDLMQAADLVRVGLAGSLRGFQMATYKGATTRLDAIDYNGQPAGYASEPSEVVNYVENHDNQTLFDNNAYKLPRTTSSIDRARVQVLGAAITAFSQGIAYFHAGIDTLRSKSMDRNSFNSGDWFNRLDWTYADNHFGTGLPPRVENEANYPLMQPLLRDAAVRPAAQDIAWTRDAFRDLLAIRGSTSLFRLRSAGDIRKRLRFHGAGAAQNPVLLAVHVDGTDYAGANFREVLYLINVDKQPQSIVIAEERGKHYVLHPVHRAPSAADLRARESRYDADNGRFLVPARTALVYVVE